MNFFKCSMGYHDWIYQPGKRLWNSQYYDIALTDKTKAKYNIDSSYIRMSKSCGDRVCSRCSRVELNFTNEFHRRLEEESDRISRKEIAMTKLIEFRKLSQDVSDL